MIKKIRPGSLMACVVDDKIREATVNSIISALKLAHPVKLVRYWHSDERVDLIGYEGMPEERATYWAKRLGWATRAVLRLKKIKEVEELNKGYSVSEHAYHNALDIVRFSDENAYEPLMIDACTWCNGV